MNLSDALQEAMTAGGPDDRKVVESIGKREEPDEREIEGFALLAKGLKKRGLPGGSGKVRKNVNPNEFIYMGGKGDSFAFKHRKSGNWLSVDKRGDIQIPKKPVSKQRMKGFVTTSATFPEEYEGSLDDLFVEAAGEREPLDEASRKMTPKQAYQELKKTRTISTAMLKPLGVSMDQFLQLGQLPKAKHDEIIDKYLKHLEQKFGK